MILRCKKMYEARIEVKRIIKLLIIQGDMATAHLQGLLERKPPAFNQEEMVLLRKYHRVTSKLDSILAMFRDDHKMFKTKFLYAGKDQYIEVPLLLSHLSRILNGFPEAQRDESVDQLASANQSLSEFENTLYIKEKQLEEITIE